MPFDKTKHAVLWLLRPFSPKHRQYWRVVLLCFFAASTFWLLNALNKSYTTRISYPIQFVYDPRQLVPVQPLPEEVNIMVTGKGWKLLRKSLMFNIKPAELLIRGLPHVTKVPGSALRPAVSSALDGLELNYVLTDTLSFEFDRMATRKIPLAMDTTNLKLQPGYVYNGAISIRPDSVTFTGPRKIIYSFSNPFPLNAPAVALKAPFKGDLPLTHDFTTLVKADVSEAEVLFNVVPLERQEIDLQPELENVPDGFKVIQGKEPLKIQFAYHPRSRVLIQPSIFRVVLDLQTLRASDSTVVPKVVQKPFLVKQVSIVPARVKVVLTPQ